MGCERHREKNQEASYFRETYLSLSHALFPFDKNGGFSGTPAHLLKATAALVEY